MSRQYNLNPAPTISGELQISFNDSGEKASVTIHKEKIKQDTESAVEQGEKLVNKATSKSKELIDQGDQGEPASENASGTEETEPAASP